MTQHSDRSASGPAFDDLVVIDREGLVELHAVIRAGVLHLVIGRADEPGAVELLGAITAVVDAANAHGGENRPAWAELYRAIEALYLAGRTA